MRRIHLIVLSVVWLLPVSVALAGVPPLDHYNVYNAFGQPPPVSGVAVTDQFGSHNTTLGPVELFLVPASKNGEGINDPFSHLTCYVEDDPVPGVPIIATNQFGSQQIDLGQSRRLCVPTEKLIAPGPVFLDHYQCYDASGPPINVGVSLADQFQQQAAVLLDPFMFCNPADKNGEGIQNPVEHLACFIYNPPGLPVGPIPILNQFLPAADFLDVVEPFALCVPSLKQIAQVPSFSPVGIGVLALTLIGTATAVVWRRRTG